MSMENVDTEVSKLESKLYKSIYNQLPDYYVSIEKVLISEESVWLVVIKINQLEKRR